MKRFLMLILCTIVYIGLSQSSSAQPINDEPSGAISIFYGQNGPFTTVDATPNPSDLDGGVCSTNDWSEPDVQSSVWFTFTGDGNNVIITTNNDCVSAGVDEILDTQIAVFEGAADGPNIACNDDITASDFYSTVQFATVAGTVYYILVDGWENDNNPLIVGEFCIEIIDASAVVCGDGICEVGEDFSTCPNDCPCIPNNVFVDIDGPSISGVAIAYCNSDTSAIPIGNIGIAVATFGGAGDLSDFPYDLTTDIGTTTGQLTTDGANVSISYVLLTQADIDAGGTVTITFQSTINTCSGTLSFDIADLNITDIAVSCGVTVCGDGICDIGEDNANCPGDCPIICGNGICDIGEDNVSCPGDCIIGVCGVFEYGPWIDIRTPSCIAGETVETGFSSWGNGAYILDVIGGVQYTFSICNGFDPTVAGWNGGVVLSAYEDVNVDGYIDDLNNPIATGTNCSLTFTAIQDGVIFLVVNDANCTGVGIPNGNGFASITTDTNCAVCGDGICDAGEDSANCPGDCPIICGNGICDIGEDSNNCLGDCPAICGNGICDSGESFVTCPNDCLCEPNPVFFDLVGSAISDIAIAFCNSDRDAIPIGSIGIPIAAFGGVGDFTDFPYDLSTNIGTTSGQLTVDAAIVNIGYLFLTQADLDAGGTVTITFQSTTINSCSSTLTFDIADLNVTNIAAFCGLDCELNIPMPYAGWHMISSYCRPDQDSITQVFSPIVNDIIQVKNLTGQVYVPSFNNFNTLTTWDITQGYLVKTFAPVTLPINGGLPVDINVDQIPLYTGWNMIAYWLQGDADPIDVFSNIAIDVIQVKDLNGAYVPSFNDFNNMGNMQETRGYQVKMGQDNTLQYNAANILPRPAPGANTDDKHLQPVHFTKNIKPNPNTSTLLIMDDENNSLNYGDELGVFNESGLLVGSFIYENAMMGGLIFGDDETEEGIDGILANEEYLFKIWNSVLDNEREVEMNFIQGNSTYQKDDLCAVSFKASSTTGINEIIGLSINANPNPATTQLTFDLEIEQAGFYNIGIYGVDGKMIDVIANRNFAAGTTQLTYNVEHLKAGLYMYRVVNGKQSYTDRFAVVR